MFYDPLRARARALGLAFTGAGHFWRMATLQIYVSSQPLTGDGTVCSGPTLCPTLSSIGVGRGLPVDGISCLCVEGPGNERLATRLDVTSNATS